VFFAVVNSHSKTKIGYFK
jgi:hypothetical protein